MASSYCFNISSPLGFIYKLQYPQQHQHHSSWFLTPSQYTANEWRWHFRGPLSHHHHVSISTNLQNDDEIKAKSLMLPLICRPFPEIPSKDIFRGDNPLFHTFSLIMFQFFLVVLLTRFIRFLLKPLKQPRIVSEIIGGILLGPSFLRHNAWFASNVIPGNAEFVANNIGVMGFMFFLFLSGVKMDTGLVKKTGKRQISTALISIVVPTVASFSVAMCMRKKMDKELAKISSLGGIAGYLGLTSCPALYNILREKNLLSSEVGRTALSIALIGDVLGVIITVVFEAAMQGETGAVHAFWFMVSVLCLTVFVVICVRKWMEWIIEKTPEGQVVSKSYVVSILLGVFVMGFLTDLFGIGIANGPLLLGLAIPDGPPLGTVIVEKTETIIMDFLMPFTFIMVGFYIDVYSLNDVGWSHLAPLFMMCLTSYLTKFLSAWVASLYWRMPLRDGLTLSLMLSLRGQIELLLFVHWMDKMMIKPPGFTVLVLITTTVTATLTPLIHILYDPTKPYMVNKRRTIQHTPPNTDLVIVLSILDTQTVSTLIHLLEVSTPSSTNPISIWALHLVELVGRTNPIFIDHNQQKVPPKYDCPRAVNALTFFQELNGSDSVKLRFFTAVTSKQTMYQDICELALLRKAAFIVVPFRRGDITMNVASHVLTHAPCSVGILVDRGLHVGGHSFRRSRKKVAMLFLGGADSREALVYADRMAENEGVNLSVARFLSFNQRGESEMEKKMDDGIVTWFWVKNERKERVEYKEVVVQNGEDTIMAIQGMNDGSFDFWIVGRRQGMNPVLLSGLSNWSENEELGLVGDFIASADFSGSASVLVVQQQILRG